MWARATRTRPRPLCRVNVCLIKVNACPTPATLWAQESAQGEAEGTVSASHFLRSEQLFDLFVSLTPYVNL